MPDKSDHKFFKRLNLLSLIIPAGILFASAFLSMQTVVRQLLIVVMLVWFGAEGIMGFPF